MASTAGGVAAGHLLLNAITGGHRGEAQPAEAQQAAPAVAQQTYGQAQQQANQNPCGLEMENFFNCTQQQYDLSMCQGLNDVLKECKMRYSQPM